MAKTQLDINTYPNNYYLKETSNVKNYTNVLLTKKKKMRGNVMISINAKDGSVGTPSVSYTVTNNNLIITPSVVNSEGWINASTITGNSMSIPVSAVVQVETKTVKSTLATLTITPTSGKYINQINIEPFIKQNKTFTPTSSTQTINYDNNYDCLEQVTVEAVPAPYTIPSGATFINQEITYNDVTNYKYVYAFGETINIFPSTNDQTITANYGDYITQAIIQPVPQPSGTITITQQYSNDVVDYEYADVISCSVTANYDSGATVILNQRVNDTPFKIKIKKGWIDSGVISLLKPSNLLPQYIKKDVTILGVTGTYDHDTYDGYYNSGSYLDSSESGYWSGAFTFSTSEDSKTLTLYLARNGNSAKIDRNIKISFAFPVVSWNEYTNYRFIATAGWSCSGTGSGSGNCKSGNNYSYQVNDSALKLYGSQNGYHYARVIFKTNGYIVPSGSTMTIKVTKTIKYTYSTGDLQYIPTYDSYTYMCYATSGNGTDLTTLLRTADRTWYVRGQSGTGVKVKFDGTIYTIEAGNNFKITTSSTYHSGYWQRTPGGQVYINPYYSYSTTLYKNGSSLISKDASLSGAISYIYVYTSNSYNAVYISY